MTDTNFIVPLEDFVNGALDLLPEYLRKENTQKFLQIFLERLEVLDNAVINLAEARVLSEAEGVVLDEIGNQMGISRGGLEDNDYRTLLLIRQIAASKGTSYPEITSTLVSLFGESAWTMYKGKNYRIDIYGNSPCFDLENIAEDIVDLFPVITHLRIIQTDPSYKAFGFDGDDSSLGFCSVKNRTDKKAGMLSRIIFTSDKATHGD